jgi:small subunit ribosomal protein S18
LATDTVASQPQAPRPRRYGPRGGEGQDERRGRFGPPQRRVCALCKDRNLRLDYKRADQLQRYITDRGKIQARRGTGMCARHQRILSLAIKRARHLALLPYTAAHVRSR